MALAQDPQAASEVSANLKDVQKFCKKYEETYNENEAVLKVTTHLNYSGLFEKFKFINCRFRA
jgi:hypothetical protein